MERSSGSVLSGDVEGSEWRDMDGESGGGGGGGEVWIESRCVGPN